MPIAKIRLAKKALPEAALVLLLVVIASTFAIAKAGESWCQVNPYPAPRLGTVEVGAADLRVGSIEIRSAKQGELTFTVMSKGIPYPMSTRRD